MLIEHDNITGFSLRGLFSFMDEPVGEPAGGGGGGGEPGSGVDADVATGTSVATDVPAIPADKFVPEGDAPTDPTPGEKPGEGGDEPFSLTYGDKTYTEDEIIEAIAARDEKATWEGKLHSRGEELNTLERALENQRLGIGGPQPAQTPGQPGEGQPGQPPEFTVEDFKELILDGDPRAMEKFNDFMDYSVNTRLNGYNTQNVAKSYFSDNYSDAEQVMQSAGFREFSSKIPTDANGEPIMGPTNAYFAYQLQEANQKVEAAEKAGFLKGEENAKANLVAKGNLRLLRAGGGVRPTTTTEPFKGTQAEMLNAATQALIAGRNNQ